MGKATDFEAKTGEAKTKSDYDYVIDTDEDLKNTAISKTPVFCGARRRRLRKPVTRGGVHARFHAGGCRSVAWRSHGHALRPNRERRAF